MNEQKLQEIEQHITDAQQEVYDLCHGKQWRMSIPVQSSDSDIIFGVLIDDVQWLVSQLRKRTPQQEAALNEAARLANISTPEFVVNAIAVRDPAQAACIRQDMDALLLKISESGGNALNTPNLPEFTVVTFSEHQAVVAHGILFTGMTAKRLVGDFKLVICMMDEMDDVLTDVFKLEKYVEASLG